MIVADIWDTPGYFYAIGYALATALLLGFEGPRRLELRHAAFHTAMLMFLIGFMALTEGIQGAGFVLSMLVIAGCVYGNFRFEIRDWRAAGFFAVKAFIYGEFSASLCWQVCYGLASAWAWARRPFGFGLAVALTFAATFAALWLAERVRARAGVSPSITGRDLLIELMTALAVFVVSNLGYLDPASIFSGSYARDVFAIRTLVDFSGVLLIGAYHSQLIEVQLRVERDALHNIRSLQYQAYELSRESIELVNQKYHDLKHQVSLLKAQADSGRAQEYLERMEREIQAFELKSNTGSDVLDAILASKQVYCKNHGIELKVMADGGLLDFMDDMDLSALFGNMLENAIESVERLQAPEKRLIRLQVDGAGQFVRIRMENYCEADVRFHDGLPVTSKPDRRFHGYGMKSMRRTVDKYGGALSASLENNWFAVKAVIPRDARASEAR